MHKFQKESFLIILISPSGGGKSTIEKMLLQEFDNIEYSISYTTRPPRANETNGKDYFFVSENKFKGMIVLDEFLEYAEVHNYWYGTSKKFIEKKNAENKHILLDIDVQGAKQIIDSGFKAVTIFILPPNSQIHQARLNNRKTDAKHVIDERLKNAKAEIDKINDFQYVVINDDLTTAFEQVKSIIIAEENKTFRYKNIKETFYGG